MSLEPGEYRITNKKVPLVLSLSDNDQRSVIAEDRGSPDNQTWIILKVDEGTVQIISKTNKQFLGPDIPVPGARLVVSPQNRNKFWEVIPDGSGFTFRLSGMPWVIQFPDGNFGPGAPAILGMPDPVTPNKVWTVTKLNDGDDLDSDEDED